MLKPKALPEILKQTINDGVKNSIIITQTGDLLASAGEDSNDKLVGAIILNIWNNYEKNDENLNLLLIDNEEGRFAIQKISKFLICIYGNKTLEFGLLKAKIEAIQKFLYEPMNQLSPT
jgi:hypothetical protein